MTLEQSDGITYNFSFFVSSFSSVSESNVFVITVFKGFVVLLLFFLGSNFLFFLFVLGVGDSLVQGSDFRFEVGDLEGQFVDSVLELSSGGGVFGNEVVVILSFDFSGFGNLVQKLVTKGDDLFDGGLVGLDGGGGGDLGHQVEDSVP